MYSTDFRLHFCSLFFFSESAVQGAVLRVVRPAATPVFPPHTAPLLLSVFSTCFVTEVIEVTAVCRGRGAAAEFFFHEGIVPTTCAGPLCLSWSDVAVALRRVKVGAWWGAVAIFAKRKGPPLLRPLVIDHRSGCRPLRDFAGHLSRSGVHLCAPTVVGVFLHRLSRGGLRRTCSCVAVLLLSAFWKRGARPT